MSEYAALLVERFGTVAEWEREARCGVNRENVTDLRRVRVEHPSESWENEASGTGASTPARTDRELLYERRAAAVDATHEPPICEPSRAARHTPLAVC